MACELMPGLACSMLQDGEHGPPEVVTGGLDGCVRVWDARQKEAPVAAFEPSEGSQVHSQPEFTPCNRG